MARHGQEDIATQLVAHLSRAFCRSRRWFPKWNDETLPHLSEEQRNSLSCPFQEEEIRLVIFSAEGNKAPGPDGFTFWFFQTFWTLVKADILQVFTELQSGRPGLGRLNASLFTLIPKRSGVSDVNEYRPICLVNVCYRIVSKVLATRMKKVSADLIEEAQTAFIPGRNLQDGYLVAQEIITTLTKDRRSGVALKLEFEKAYDSVHRDFLYQVLAQHGFEEQWVMILQRCMETGHGSVLLNGSPHEFFPLDRGLRQGDPLSPILFIYVVKALCRMCKVAMRGGWYNGLASTSSGHRVALVQYADDTLMRFEAMEADARAARFITFCFELVSGLSLNWSKSVLLAVNVPEPQRQVLARIVGCEVRDFPARVLGLPLSSSKRKTGTPE
ncbi:hypothetical protein QJS10_CPB04g01321 [Acorus calamus]|uniref:Reverse transcriptase domain-containing protein n=1 Tax=Acorus calamus TaxID=4465 RepID=A0AAV9F1L1_ACOCL|nr:hypothetical protein QJS10_CPB04g01321 [Acorus calamus]